MKLMNNHGNWAPDLSKNINSHVKFLEFLEVDQDVDYSARKPIV
jgi:hypothetical protein